MNGKIKANINSKIDFYKSFNRKYLYNIIIFLLYLYLSLSTSFQVFKGFNIENTSDPKSYIQMANGNYKVNSTHRYRFIIPKTVSFVRPFLGNFYNSNSVMDETKAKEKNDRFIFFIVNSIISASTAYLTFKYITYLGLGYLGGLIGGVFFLLSPVIIVSTGTPLIDSLQYLCLILYSIFILNNQFNKLSLLFPLMVLSKETLIPLIFVPLIQKESRKKSILISIILSILILVIVRSILYESDYDYESNLNLYQNFLNHGLYSLERFKRFFTFRGIYRALYSYGFILFLSLLGYLINRSRSDINIPKSINILIPYSLFLSLLSNDTGRMLYIAFPIIIPYSIYFIVKQRNKWNFKFYLQFLILQKFL